MFEAKNLADYISMPTGLLNCLVWAPTFQDNYEYMAKWDDRAALRSGIQQKLLKFHLLSIANEFSKWKANKNTAMWNK